MGKRKRLFILGLLMALISGAILIRSLARRSVGTLYALNQPILYSTSEHGGATVIDNGQMRTILHHRLPPLMFTHNQLVFWDEADKKIGVFCKGMGLRWIAFAQSRPVLPEWVGGLDTAIGGVLVSWYREEEVDGVPLAVPSRIMWVDVRDGRTIPFPSSILDAKSTTQHDLFVVLTRDWKFSLYTSSSNRVHDTHLIDPHTHVSSWDYDPQEDTLVYIAQNALHIIKSFKHSPHEIIVRSRSFGIYLLTTNVQVTAHQVWTTDVQSITTIPALFLSRESQIRAYSYDGNFLGVIARRPSPIIFGERMLILTESQLKLFEAYVNDIL